MEKKRILVIDDELDFIRLLKINLEQTGKYEVRIESNGLSGIATAKTFKPNLILLDIIMDGMDGTDVCYRLENNNDTKNIPIIFLTAVVEKQEVESSGGLIGGHHFIAKPVGIEQLVYFIEKNIR
jgi:CheY-like chemotaxis protein